MDYGDEVCYPFGYGLSYGTKDGQPFEQKLVSAKVTEDGFEAEVKLQILEIWQEKYCSALCTAAI